MSLFNKNAPAQAASTPLGVLEAKYTKSVYNLLLVVVFTVINVVLLATNANSYFLFSAYIPYFAVDLGMYFCGLYPAEYYYGDEEFFGMGFFAIMMAIAVVMVVLYLLCWFFAKKKKVGWLIFAMVLFVADTAFLIYNCGISADIAIDIVFHVWVLFCIGNAINIYNKIKKLPAEIPATPMEEAEMAGTQQMYGNSNVLRMADPDVKCRVLLEGEEAGYNIVYRRVGRINELVVNGRVYDEYEALMETPHNLVAYIDSRKIEAGTDETSRMYIYVDGKEIAKKLRLI